MPENTGFAAELRRLRADRGLSLAQLAALAHYSKSYLSNVELGRKAASAELARRLDVALASQGRLTGLLAESTPRCPYQGLAAFQAEDADWFFGRRQTTEELSQRLAEGRDTGLPMVVFGASGAGKSSLLRAGLAPALAKDGEVRVITPTARPLEVLPEAADVLVVDQFEEVFTLCPAEPERREFIAALAELARAGTPVVLGVRADFYAACVAYPELLAAVRHNQFTVGAMCREELVEVITGPARTARLTVEPGLVELLLRDLGLTDDPAARYDPGALPLLSFALLSTWERREGRQLTIAAYRQAGGIRGAVRAAAEGAYAGLPEPARLALRRVLPRLIHLDDRNAPSRRRARQADLVRGKEDPARLAIDALVGARLLVLDRDTVEIVHETLPEAWPRLRDWLAESREGLRVHRRLAEAAEEWAALDRDPDALYRGLSLDRALDWARADPDQLTAREKEFLTAAEAARDRELTARAGRARVLRRLVAVLAALVLLTTTATVLAVRAQSAGAEQRTAAVARKVLAEAAAIGPANPALSSQLILAAHRLSPSPETQASLLSSQAVRPASRLTGHTGQVRRVAYSPDGALLATAASDHTVRLWQVADPDHPRELAVLRGHTSAVTTVVFSPDGRTLVSSGTDHQVRLWRVSDGTALAVLSAHRNHVSGLAVSPDGRVLASGSLDGSVRLWDLRAPGEPSPLGQFSAPRMLVNDLSFSPDGRLLAAGSRDGAVRLWPVTEPARLGEPVLLSHGAEVETLAFSPDGALLAAGGAANHVQLWRLDPGSRPRELARLTGHTDFVWATAFSPDGRRLATGSSDQTTRLWDLADPAHPREQLSLSGHTNAVYSVAFRPDGAVLATSGDRTARLEDLRPHDLSLGAGRIGVTALRPDGRLLAVGGEQGTVTLWDPADLRRPRRIGALTGHRVAVVAAAFSPDGRLLITSAEDDITRVWDVGDPARPRELGRVGEDVSYGLAFTPDNRRLVTGGGDYHVRLWDLADPAQPRLLADLGQQDSSVLGVAVSADGRLLASASTDTTLRLWRLDGGAEPRLLAVRHTGAAQHSVTIHPGGRLLATASGDHTVRLWDIGDPAEPAELPALTGHRDVVTRVAFAADGTRLASASTDRTARLWQLDEHGRPTGSSVLQGHTKAISGLALGPGGVVATGGDDHAARLWLADPAEVARRICATADAPLSTADWERHFPGEPYTPPC